jgi:NADH dehydrogenase [ubiquinone] 1 alpha subcomplex assembly factor 5
MNNNIFNRQKLFDQNGKIIEKFADYNFLHQESMSRAIENLAIEKQKFSKILEIGAKNNQLILQLQNENLLEKNFSCYFLHFHNNFKHLSKLNSKSDSQFNLVADEELLPFKANSFDLIFSNLNLHFINELPFFLQQIYATLKKGGIFIATFFGEENLLQLKKAIIATQITIYNKIWAIMPPLIELKTAGKIMLQTGFSQSVAMVDKMMVEYKNLFSLLQDLKQMGQGNFLLQKNYCFFTKKLIAEIEKNYLNQNNKINANFEIITICGKKI